jgi:hypothetical protein
MATLRQTAGVRGALSRVLRGPGPGRAWLLRAVVLAAAAAPGAPATPDEPAPTRPRKKLIEAGWDMPTTAQLRKHLAEIEARPFDGVILQAVGRRGDGKPVVLGPAFTAEVWERAWFQPAVDDLKACNSKRLTDNFVMLGANPGGVDWFDDAGWKQVVEHWRIDRKSVV